MIDGLSRDVVRRAVAYVRALDHAGHAKKAAHGYRPDPAWSRARKGKRAALRDLEAAARALMETEA